MQFVERVNFDRQGVYLIEGQTRPRLEQREAHTRPGLKFEISNLSFFRSLLLVQSIENQDKHRDGGGMIRDVA